MTDIFFSYSREDKDRIAFIAAALEAEGYDLWWDTDIAPGETYREVTQQKLREAKCVIVVWSETSVKSRWVIGEAEEGLHREILLPVMIDAVLRNIPIDFRSVQTANLTHWRGDRSDSEWKKVLAQVKRLVAEPAKPPQPYKKPKRSGPGGLRALFGIAIFLSVILTGAAFLMWSYQMSPMHQLDDYLDKVEINGVETTTETVLNFVVSEYGLEVLERLVSAGHPVAASILARAYEDGLFVVKDEQQAAKLNRQSCDGGAMVGCSNLGSAFRYGRGVDINYQRAVELYRLACDSGVTFACGNLGSMYMIGEGVEKDFDQALALMAPSCVAGEGPRCLDLGSMYFYGLGVERDYSKAFSYFGAACDRTESYGCFQLGNMYFSGWGVTKDGKEAFRYFEMACNLGLMIGCRVVGVSYQNGTIVDRSYVKAKEYYTLACDENDYPACRLLGGLYQNGRGVVLDQGEARRLYRKACDGEDQAACVLLND